jgi:hypothetical protein
MSATNTDKKTGTKKSKKAKPEAGEKKMSALDAAAKVLEQKGTAMTCQELIGVMAAKGYWSSPNGDARSNSLRRIDQGDRDQRYRLPLQEDRPRTVRGQGLAYHAGDRRDDSGQEEPGEEEQEREGRGSRRSANRRECLTYPPAFRPRGPHERGPLRVHAALPRASPASRRTVAVITRHAARTPARSLAA